MARTRLKLEYSRVARAYRFLVEGDGDALSFSWTKDEAKAQYMRLTEGAYLLRTNRAGHEEPELWKMYMQLKDAEARTSSSAPSTTRPSTVRVLDSLAGIKSGDIVLPLVDGRELKLRRVSRPDPQQAEILTRLGLDLPERVGTDTVHLPGVVQTWP
jgi:hypothetical protein